MNDSLLHLAARLSQQTPTTTPITAPPGVASTSLNEVVQNVITWGLGAAAATAVLILLVGGFFYITAAGDSARIEKGKKTVQGAIIGLIIIIISGVIVFTINEILQPGGTAPTP